MSLRSKYVKALLQIKRGKEFTKKNPKMAGAIALAGIIAVSFVMTQINFKEDLPASQDVYVQVVKVEAKSMENLSELSGTLEPIEEATVSFEVSGTVKSLNVQEGSKVNAGDVLASVDRANYDLQSQQVEAQSKSAKIAYNQAVTNLQRYEILYNEGAISKVDYENAQNAMEQASAAYMQVSSLQQQTQLASSKTSLISPICGVVITEYISKGQLISAGTPAYKIGNIDKLKVSLLVPDSEISSWKVSDKITVKLYDESFTGEVTNIFPSINENTGGITVEVTVDNAEHNWYSGQVVTCSHNSGTRTGIYIPKEAVISNGGSSAYVFILKNNKAVKTKVAVGTLINNLLEIKLGLKENEKVIVKGADRLSDGEEVKVIGSVTSSD